VVQYVYKEPKDHNEKLRGYFYCKVIFTLEQPVGARRGLRCSSTFSLTLALDEVGGQHHTRTALRPSRRLCSHFTEGCVSSRPVWTGAENIAPTGIRSPDCLARSDLL
jgi:hypothetical protein